MNEEDLRLVRQIVKRNRREILDAEVWDSILELVDGLEAGIAAFKQRLGVVKGIQAEPSWIPDAIKWQQAQGSSGLYERSEDVNNSEFKAMLGFSKMALLWVGKSGAERFGWNFAWVCLQLWKPSLTKQM